MKYLIKSQSTLLKNAKTINEQAFNELKIAREILINALSIEEAYDIIIINYIDFEQSLSKQTIEFLVYFANYSYMDFYKTRSLLNAKLANLLTVIQMYQDQTEHKIKYCLPNISDLKSTVHPFFSKEYENNIEYQFMEQFRNFVQHQGLPIHNVLYSSHLTENDEDGMIEYSLNIKSNREILEKEKAIKNVILEKLDDKVNLKYFTRVYMECISNVHQEIRNLINENVEKSRILLEEIRTSYSTNVSENLVGLSAYCYDNDGNLEEEIPLLLDWDDIRRELIRKNNRLVHLDKCYASGAPERKVKK